MAISSTRLEELRTMSHEDYLKTPEWRETRKRILKRDSYMCAGCHDKQPGVIVHHYTRDPMQRELDTDLVVLCTPCLQELQRKLVETPDLPFLQKCGIGLGAAAIGTIGFEGLLHAPLPAEIGVIIGAYLLAKNSPKAYAWLKGRVPAEALAWLGQAPESGKPSALDIWLGRTPKRVEVVEVASYAPESEEIPQGVESAPIFPRYKDDETLRLGQAIDKQALKVLTRAFQTDPRARLPRVAGQRFEPHINALFGKGAIFAAVQGSGKSMLNGLIIEQAGECDAPAIVLDHKGEYPPITELGHLSGMIAGGESAERKAAQLGVPYFALTTENADAFVEMVIAEHLQAIVVLPSYGESWLAKAEIVAEVGQALMRYSGRQRQQEKKVLPCLIFLDEAQLYLPQNPNLLPPEAKRNQDVLDNLSNAYFSLVSNGRSNGYTMCFATQSLTYIAKWAIKSCQIRVIMRHVEHNDLKMCEEIIGSGLITREEIEIMPSGVGVAFGFTPRPMIVQFDTRKSRDESETPGVERLRHHRQPMTPHYTVSTQEMDERSYGNREETNTQAPSRRNTDELEMQETGSSGNEETAFPSTKVAKPDVPPEILETIRRMKRARPRKNDSDIAKFVGLAGRKYGTYRQAVQWIKQEAR